MLYGQTVMESIEKMGNSDAVLEAFLVDDIMRQDENKIKEFCESAEAQILVEKAVLKKPTLIRLDAASDLNRRTKIIAYMLAKEAGDPNFAKLKKYTALRKECIKKIMDKYGLKANKIANVAQKNYIKTAAKVSGSAKEEKNEDK